MNIHDFKFEGEWIGHYEGHFDQVIKIERKNGIIKAYKVTGDKYVPAGELTWMAHTLINEAYGVIAQEGFQDPHFVPGCLSVISEDRILFRWKDKGQVEYRRDD